MGLPGVTDSSVYKGLSDVLRRQPEVTSITYEPDSITRQFLRAQLAPDRLRQATGPESPTIDVEWRYVDDEQYYRIHYADPNTGFNCGWHRDEDHPDLGPVHFQCAHPSTDESKYESAQFAKTLPTEILWSALEELFDKRLPALANS